MPIAPQKHNAQRRKSTPALKRRTAHQRGYTNRWHAYSQHRLRSNPICVRCGELATVTDHILPHSGQQDPLFWAPDNHQSLCKRCHDRKTALEDRGFGRKK
jgi:5-methylcytosine-specific restriction protein A